MVTRMGSWVSARTGGTIVTLPTSKGTQTLTAPKAGVPTQRPRIRPLTITNWLQRACQESPPYHFQPNQLGSLPIYWSTSLGKAISGYGFAPKTSHRVCFEL